MINLPMKAFCLNGNNEKIELTINEVLGFPENTSIEGGYDFKGSIEIGVGSYNVLCREFYSSTGILYKLLTGLNDCYTNLEGTAEYNPIYDNNLEFNLTMTSYGHAELKGRFKEFAHL